LVTDCHSIWLGGGNISQLLNVHGVNDVRQTEILTAEPLELEPSAFEVEMVTEKLKDESPGIDQFTTELIEAGGRKIHSEILTLNNSIWNRQELP